MRRVATFVFAQMLPATLVAPAIRPFFAAHHGGAEGPMHAFMSVNMAGALLAAPICGALVDRIGRAPWLLAMLAATDALLFLAMGTLEVPVSVLLALRFVEGAAHVGAATLLLSAAAAIAREHGTGRAMGAAGAALLVAVSLGHALGAGLLRIDPRAPFVASSLVALAVAFAALRFPLRLGGHEARERVTWREHLGVVWRHRDLAPVVLSVFVGRFTVGCLVVTFALWARATHSLSDSNIGLLFAALTGVFALATYPAGRVCDRVPPALVLVLAAFSYAACLGLIARVPAGGLLPLFVLAGIASGFFFAAALHEVGARTSAEARGRVSAAVHAAGCLGMLVGPIVAGVVGSRGPEAREHVFAIAAGSLGVWAVVAAPWALARLRSAPRPMTSRSASDSDSAASGIARPAPSAS